MRPNSITIRGLFRGVINSYIVLACLQIADPPVPVMTRPRMKTGNECACDVTRFPIAKSLRGLYKFSKYNVAHQPKVRWMDSGGFSTHKDEPSTMIRGEKIEAKRPARGAQLDMAIRNDEVNQDASS